MSVVHAPQDNTKLTRRIRLSGLGILALAVTATLPILASDDSPAAPANVADSFADRPPVDAAGLKAIQRNIQSVARTAVPCTVGISVGLSHGSGVIVSPDGYVITAAHVVGRPGTKVRLMLSGGRTVRGIALGRNPQSDVGLVKIIERGVWPFARMGTSTNVRVGQWCLATGHPGGYEDGRAAALRIGRVTGAWRTTIRTDCTLIHGDSGGPLFDLAGRVIGIHSRVGRPVAANLHIPINSFRQDWNRLLAGYDGQSADGANGQPANKSSTTGANRPSSDHDPGLISAIRRQVRGPPGRESGKNHELVRLAFREVISEANRGTVRLFADDKLVALGAIIDAEGHVLTKASEMRGRVVCRFADGRRVPAKVLAMDESHDLALVRVPGNQMKPIQFRSPSPLNVGSILATPGGFGDKPIAIGVVSLAAMRVHAAALGIRMGHSDDGPIVGSVQPGSTTEKAGILPRDVIVGLDGAPVKTAQDLLKKVREHQPGDIVRLSIRRGSAPLEIKVPLERAGQIPATDEATNRAANPVISRRRFDFPMVIQTDSALHANQCGGPVVDLDGMVVGVNIARASRVSSYALPAERVARVITRLKATAQSQPQPSVAPAQQVQ